MQEKFETILPHTCPHCGKKVYIEMVQYMPEEIGILTEEEITEAKESLCLEARKMIIEPEKLIDLMNWIDKKDTIISAKDIDKIIQNTINK